MAKTARLAAVQLPLPRRVIRIDPPNLGSADCPAIGICDDSFSYAVKDGHTHPLVPHAEWFCTRLAGLIGISCPESQILEMPGGDLAFGSRWEGGVLDASGIPPPWVAKVQTGDIPLDGLRIPLTRIYAFDLFIHNPDRHGRNFLVLEHRQGNYGILAFDFSRAWAVNGFPLPALPFDANHPNERTIRCQRQLRQVWQDDYIDPAEADEFCSRIKRIPKQEIVKIIDAHPKKWLPSTVRQAIVRWWQSKEMLARIDGISAGIRDGTYI